MYVCMYVCMYGVVCIYACTRADSDLQAACHLFLTVLARRASASVPLTQIVLRRCERVLFFGTRFSNLYTAVDTPAEAA